MFDNAHNHSPLTRLMSKFNVNDDPGSVERLPGVDYMKYVCFKLLKNQMGIKTERDKSSCEEAQRVSEASTTRSRCCCVTSVDVNPFMGHEFPFHTTRAFITALKAL